MMNKLPAQDRECDKQCKRGFVNILREKCVFPAMVSLPPTCMCYKMAQCASQRGTVVEAATKKHAI
eukprot:6462447-Amphidinium_carterae.3